MGKIDKALDKLIPTDYDDEGSEGGSKTSSLLDAALNDASSNPRLREQWDERLLSATDIATPIAESFRKLRTTILHPPDGRVVRSVLVTSAVPGEGKSFICANLGVTLSHGVEQSALLIECDLRRPSLSQQLFGITSNAGLSTYLQGDVDLGSLIRPTGSPKLSLLPSGPPPTNPAELLDSHKMATMLEELVYHYPNHYVLLDSPPVQGAAEVAVLSQYVDAVIVVVRWGKAGREQVRQVINTVGREKVMGVVFNAFELNALESTLLSKGYYGYYASTY